MPEIEELLVQYTLTGDLADFCRPILGRLRAIEPAPDAVDDAHARKIRAVFGRAISSGFFRHSKQEPALLVLESELALRGRSAKATTAELPGFLGVVPTPGADVVTEADKVREANYRLRRTLQHVADQAIEDDRIIELPGHSAGRESVYRPRLSFRAVLTKERCEDHLEHQSGAEQATYRELLARDLLATPAGMALDARLISAAAILVEGEITLLLSQWPQTRWNDLFAVVLAMHGVEASPGELRSGGTICVPSDPRILSASGLLHVAVVDGRLAVAPVHGDRFYFLWHVATYFEQPNRESMGRADLFRRLVSRPSQVSSTPARSRGARKSGRQWPVAVNRVVILTEDKDWKHCTFDRLDTNQIRKVASALSGNTVLRASASGVDLEWPSAFLEDIQIPPVYELRLPRQRAAFDFADAASHLRGPAKEPASEQDRLRDVLSRDPAITVSPDGTVSAGSATVPLPGFYRAVKTFLIEMLTGLATRAAAKEGPSQSRRT